MGRRTILLLAGFAVALSLNGCSPTQQTAQTPPQRDAWHWVAPGRIAVNLGNGALGLKVRAPGLDVASQPLILWEDRLARLPLPFECGLRIDGIPYPRADQTSVSIQDFRDGSVTFLCEGGGVRIEAQWIVHPKTLAIGRRIRVEAPKKTIRLQPTEPPARLEATWISPAEGGIPSATVVIRAARTTSGRVQGATILAQDSLSFEETFTLDGAPPDPFDRLLAASRAIWDERWKGDIEISGPEEDQHVIRSLLYHLYAFSSPKMPPFGATNDAYHGHRFWDAEAWILPALALFDPNSAREATQWRVRTALEQLPGWETGVDGRDVTPESHRRAIHHWGWIAWWLERATAFGIVEPSEEIARVNESLRDAFRNQLTESAGGYEILDVLAPDEGRPHDNDLITNLLAKRLLAESDPEVAARIVLPRAEDGLLASYDNDPLRGYQQTSALLALYPLETPLPQREAEALFDRYKGLSSENGPAMSDSVHATIAARLGRSAEAYEFWRRSWEPFMDAAGQFSERAKNNQTYFLTGAAGCLQTVLYGFAGLRVVGEQPADAARAIPLQGGFWLEISPRFPPKWSSLILRGISVGGKRYDIHLTREQVSVQPSAE
ncbi:MAG: hypothetical protein KatS3mg015_1842 [Fimbriimonadales bacterium]|nr:MAG: hypothetical protein KatS3mg015_1842 [Fimbriimonadales bacterium]